MQRMLEAIASGMKRSPAYRLAGIATTTFYDWMAKGKDPTHEPYASFRRNLLVAEAAIVEQMTDMVMTHAVDDWKAAAWWLERVHPKTFGKRALPPIVVKQDGALDDPTKQAELLVSIEAAVKSRTSK